MTASEAEGIDGTIMTGRCVVNINSGCCIQTVLAIEVQDVLHYNSLCFSGGEGKLMAVVGWMYGWVSWLGG